MNAHIRQWTPSNRTAARICVVLYRALNAGRIQLTFDQTMRVREGNFSTRFWPRDRAALGRLWSHHGGLELAREIGQLENIDADVIEDMRNSMCA